MCVRVHVQSCLGMFIYVQHYGKVFAPDLIDLIFQIQIFPIMQLILTENEVNVRKQNTIFNKHSIY